MSQALLEIDAVSKRFGQVVVIEDLSFCVQPGQTLGVIGPNGAGKSTMLNLISGVLAPDRGSIRFGGSDITRVGAARRCRGGIGRSYQIPRPFAGMTVFENVLVSASFGAGQRGKAAQAAALAALETTDLAQHANTLAGSLRLMDRKRLELARALASDPTLVLLDEIAGGLSEHELPDLIETIRTVQAAGVTIIWIEHVVHALLAVAQRLMCLTYGRMLAIGPPAEVLANAEVRETYLGVGPEAESIENIITTTVLDDEPRGER